MIDAVRNLLPDASIRRKLILGVAFVHLLLMTIFVLDLVQRQREFLLSELTHRTLHHALVLAVASSAWVLSDDLVGMEEVLESGVRGGGARHAMIVDPQGRVLAHTDRSRIGQYLADTASREALAGEQAPRVFQENESTLHAIAPIVVANRLIGWSLLVVDKSATSAHLAYVTRTGIAYTLAAIAIGTLFAMLLSRSILRQLRHVLKGVDRLQHDLLDQPVAIVSRDEVGRVAEAFNRALASLAESRERLNREVEERTRAEEAIRLLSRRQVVAIEEERKRIARDLHDELGQVLSGMQFCLRSMQGETTRGRAAASELCRRLSTEVEQMGVSIHRIANNLRPATLDHLGLLPAIEAFVAEQVPAMDASLKVNIETAGFRRRLPAEAEMVAYRIIQEGLTNVIKHARARQVDLQLTVNHPRLIIAIRDDGIGIPCEARLNGSSSVEGGIGLLGMQERAASIGGKLELRPRRGGGSTLRAELPYAEDSSDGQASDPDR